MTRRTLARAYAVLFAVSTAFPVAASLMPPSAMSRTMGVLDVACALVLLATGIYIVSIKAPASAATNSRAVAWYRASSSVPLLLLVIFFVVASRVRWEVLLAGLAWRAWLFYYTLPAALALLNAGDE